MHLISILLLDLTQLYLKLYLTQKHTSLLMFFCFLRNDTFEFPYGSWCFMSLNNISAILVEKTTDLSQVTDKLYHIMLYLVHLAMNATLLVIGTDCTGSCKSNYHTIMTMTSPKNKIQHLFLQTYLLK